MKKIHLLLILFLSSLVACAQGNPDKFPDGVKIPFTQLDTLTTVQRNALTIPNDGSKVIYNITIDSIQYSDPKTLTWKSLGVGDMTKAVYDPTNINASAFDYNNFINTPTIVNPTGLEAIDEGNGIGWRLIGRDSLFYGNIGLNSIDFSSPPAGSGNGATGNNTFVGTAIYSTASGNNSFIGTGTNNIASGGDNFVGSGSNNDAIGFRSVILGGTGNIANGGSSSILGGTNNIADGAYSAAIGGRFLEAESYSEIALGTANTTYTPVNPFGFEVLDRILVVGNGASNVSRSDAMIILKNGQVTFPSLTTALIDAEATGKVATTREWIEAQGFGAGGSTTYTGLTDTPNSLLGQANLIPRVNAGETAIEFTNDVQQFYPDSPLKTTKWVGTQAEYNIKFPSGPSATDEIWITDGASPTLLASDITNTPSGNLSATDVQGALNELQTDVDTRALSSDLSNYVTLNGSQTITGVKTFNGLNQFNETQTFNMPAFGSAMILNNSTGFAGLYINFTGSGQGISIDNNTGGGSGLLVNSGSTGEGVRVNNSGTGTGVTISNSSTGVGLNVNGGSSVGIQTSNTTGQSIFNNNTGTGDGIVSNGNVSSSGLLFVGQNAGVNTFTVNKTGDIVGNTLNLGGTGDIVLDNGTTTAISNFPTLDGTQTFTGYNQFNNNDATPAIRVINSSATGSGAEFQNQITGGIGITGTNNVDGVFFSGSNANAGSFFKINGGASSTGFLWEGQNNGTTTSTINKEGDVVANTLAITGGTGANVLLDDGTTTPVSGLGGSFLSEATLTITNPDFTGGANIDNTIISAGGAGTLIEVVNVIVFTQNYTSATTATTWSVNYIGDGGFLINGNAAVSGSNTFGVSQGNSVSARYFDASNTGINFRLSHSTAETTTGTIDVKVLYRTWTY